MYYKDTIRLLYFIRGLMDRNRHHTVPLNIKGEIPEKNVSKDPSMDSIYKIYFDLDSFDQKAESVLEVLWKSRSPFMGILFSASFSEIPSKRLKI